jgi:activating signal cointegrator 1
MKAITIWQPYATLIMLGLKEFETRSWSTNYRGPLVIHAAKRWDDDRAYDCQRVAELLHECTFSPSQLDEDQRRLMYMPTSDTLGGALGVVDLTDCQQMDEGGSYFENEVGSFGPGRFGWKCERPRIFETPIAAQGKQGLWTPDARLEQLVNDLMGVVHDHV